VNSGRMAYGVKPLSVRNNWEKWVPDTPKKRLSRPSSQRVPRVKGVEHEKPMFGKGQEKVDREKNRSSREKNTKKGGGGGGAGGTWRPVKVELADPWIRKVGRGGSKEARAGRVKKLSEEIQPTPENSCKIKGIAREREKNL